MVWTTMIGFSASVVIRKVNWTHQSKCPPPLGRSCMPPFCICTFWQSHSTVFICRYAGWTTTCGRTKRDPQNLICWGDKSSPIITGNVSKSPFAKRTVWLSVSLSSMHACAVYADNNKTLGPGGYLVCWGDDKLVGSMLYL